MKHQAEGIRKSAGLENKDLSLIPASQLSTLISGHFRVAQAVYCTRPSSTRCILRPAKRTLLSEPPAIVTKMSQCRDIFAMLVCSNLNAGACSSRFSRASENRHRRPWDKIHTRQRVSREAVGHHSGTAQMATITYCCTYVRPS